MVTSCRSVQYFVRMFDNFSTLLCWWSLNSSPMLIISSHFAFSSFPCCFNFPKRSFLASGNAECFFIHVSCTLPIRLCGEQRSMVIVFVLYFTTWWQITSNAGVAIPMFMFFGIHLGYFENFAIHMWNG